MRRPAGRGRRRAMEHGAPALAEDGTMTSSSFNRAGAPAAHAAPQRRGQGFASRAFARFAVAAATALGVSLGATAASAAPEAHILRIDPRASIVDGAPVL